MRLTHRVKKYLVSSVGDKSPSVGEEPLAPSASAIGMKAARAKELAERRANMLVESRSRAKRVEHAMHADIGSLLDGIAQLHELSVLHVLGLASALKRLLEEPNSRESLAEEGSRLYLAEHRPTFGLTVVGALSDPDAAEALRKVGFTRTGKQWAGVADIAEAISLARIHSLSLLRYDEDHTPRFYIRKGLDQPELEELLQEERRQQTETEAFLSGFANETGNIKERSVIDIEGPSIDIPLARNSGSLLEGDISDADNGTTVTAEALMTEPSELPMDEPKPLPVQMGLKRPGKPLGAQ